MTICCGSELPGAENKKAPLPDLSGEGLC